MGGALTALSGPQSPRSYGSWTFPARFAYVYLRRQSTSRDIVPSFTYSSLFLLVYAEKIVLDVLS